MAKKKSVQQAGKTPKRGDSFAMQIAPKAQSITRKDIKDWQAAIRAATNIDNPRRAKLQNLFADILLDAHLTAQLELRRQATLSTPFVLKNDDATDDQATQTLLLAPWVHRLARHAYDEQLMGHSLVEFATNTAGVLDVVLIPRTNVVPEQGVILLKEDDNKGVNYRETREYGTWLLEFGDPSNLGLLNKAVPHVLFKKFAQACWSELCEIYGIPPRVLKTNTQDPEMLSRAEAMMRDMGSAAWYIVDTEESFDFADGMSTSGDVYSNLISLCNNELSLLISGAVVGQDTKNGSRSKEQASIGLLDSLITADKRRMEAHWNTTILPALVRLGVVKEGLRFEYQPQEDLEKLFEKTYKVMQYMDVKPEWVKSTFGIEVTGIRKTPEPQKLTIEDFFA